MNKLNKNKIENFNIFPNIKKEYFKEKDQTQL